MLQQPIPSSTPASWLAAHKPERPVHFFAPTALDAKLAEFRSGFPGVVTFAVKSNPAEQVIARLWAAGIGGFDVASPDEIAMVARLCPGAPMHYNNPVRSLAEIAAGVAAGVTSWSVDDPGELDKLAGLAPGSEIAVRFKLPVAGAAYNFGTKFGAIPNEAVTLLQEVARRGYAPALCFHVGTQCATPDAYVAYILAAADIAQRSGVAIKRLNVGGGFPSARDGRPVDLQSFFDAIDSATAAFAVRPTLICEPGRGMTADAFAYAVQIKSLRPGRVYLSDGVYGGLFEFTSMGLTAWQALGPTGRQRHGTPTLRTVFGPTCDSLDVLPGEMPLPADLATGDWLVFGSMGAYLTGLTTRFNGYGDFQTVEVAGLV
jgi:ornithine decarboxylase